MAQLKLLFNGKWRENKNIQNCIRANRLRWADHAERTIANPTQRRILGVNFSWKRGGGREEDPEADGGSSWKNSWES